MLQFLKSLKLWSGHKVLHIFVVLKTPNWDECSSCGLTRKRLEKLSMGLQKVNQAEPTCGFLQQGDSLGRAEESCEWFFLGRSQLLEVNCVVYGGPVRSWMFQNSFSVVTTLLELFELWGLQSDFTVVSFLTCYYTILLQWKIKGSTYSLKQILLQLQSKLTMAVVTERTKNSSSACSSATTKMPSGALTLNTGLLGYNLYRHSIRECFVWVPGTYNDSWGQRVYKESLAEFLSLLLLLGAMVGSFSSSLCNTSFEVVQMLLAV